MDKSTGYITATIARALILFILASFMLMVLAGCATTVTTGNYTAEKGLSFKSYTTFFGGAAGENAKNLSFLVETPEGLHVEAEGQANTQATTPDINALANAIAAGIAGALAP